ncbi:MAG: hypothetical protein GXO76_13440 [Calditrichaeota bacterium]|nr:hypothetical protein [Calditrichota bacterium]
MTKSLRIGWFSVFLLLSFVSCSKGGSYSRTVLLQTPWGSAPGQFGLLKEAEGVAPEALTVDASGNLWVIDLVNSRVQGFREDGRFIRAFPIRSRAMDITSGPNGWLYLLAPYDGQISIIDTLGRFKKSFLVPSSINLLEGIRWQNDRLVVLTSEQKTYALLDQSQIKTISQIPSLLKATAQPLEGLAGRFGKNRYRTLWKSEDAGEIWVLDASGRNTHTISISPQAHLGAVQYLNSDQKNNFYVLEEILPEPGKSVFSVLRYSPDGKLMAKIDIPNENIADIHRPITIDAKGTIYFMRILPESFSILKWEWRQ